ncbi:hypothetical protein F2Q70_00014475 [Brassica cretica]|uniref:Uncharacterized protein n=1 Tax=Brassica cretica TaxID=69181 RepID=A0A8S9HW99_BRACR|nr:hypothetical protein F2Q70_00014475 [Brassica cretica]
MRPQARPQRHQQQQVYLSLSLSLSLAFTSSTEPKTFVLTSLFSLCLCRTMAIIISTNTMGTKPPVNPHPMMPMHPQFFFNNLNMPQQQQFQQFGLPNHINQLLPNLLGNLMGGYSLPPLVHPTVFQPPLDPSAFTLLSHRLTPFPILLVSQSQDHSVNNNVTSNSKGNDFRNKFTKQQKFKGTGQEFQRSQLHQADHVKKKFGFSKDHLSKGNNKKISTGLDGSDADNIAKGKKRSSALW